MCAYCEESSRERYNYSVAGGVSLHRREHDCARWALLSDRLHPTAGPQSVAKDDWIVKRKVPTVIVHACNAAS